MASRAILSEDDVQMTIKLLLTSIAALFLTTGTATTRLIAAEDMFSKPFRDQIVTELFGKRIISERIFEADSYYHPVFTWADYTVLLVHKLLPPLQYDHPFNGRLKVITLEDAQDAGGICRLVWGGLPNLDITKVIPAGSVACAVIPPVLNPKSGIDCLIYRPPDLAIWEGGLTPSILMRHEIGHCNGWRNHEGIRGFERRNTQ